MTTKISEGLKFKRPYGYTIQTVLIEKIGQPYQEHSCWGGYTVQKVWVLFINEDGGSYGGPFDYSTIQEWYDESLQS